jgi:hypothetical protein
MVPEVQGLLKLLNSSSLFLVHLRIGLPSMLPVVVAQVDVVKNLIVFTFLTLNTILHFIMLFIIVS